MNIVLYVAVAIVVLFFMMQLLTVRMAKKSKGIRLKGLSGDLQKLEKEGSKGLVYFYSPSCGACRTQTPIIKELQKQHGNVYDVDVSKDLKTAQAFGIRATPSTVSVQDGIIREVLLGAKPRQVLERIIAK